MRILSATAPRARALCLALCLAAAAPQASAFRLGALITRARAPKPLQKPDARKAWLDAAVVGPLPPWLNEARRGWTRPDGAWQSATPRPSCPSSTRRSPTRSTRRRAPRSRTSPRPSRQRAAAWAETRAPFARWTAAHYGVPIDAPQLGEALELLYGEY